MQREERQGGRYFERSCVVTIGWEKVDGVVFDFGGVLSVSPMREKWDRTLYPYCETLGLRREKALEGFSKFRRLWDGDDLSFAAMYELIFAWAGLARPTDEQLAEIYRLDAASWAEELRPDTLELMKEVKAHGKRIGILSNMSSDFHRDLFAPRFGECRALADVEVISGFERACKPERRIYDITRERMGCEAARLLFFDDSLPNVLAARAYGWQSELYV